MNVPLSVVILAKNEAGRLAECLRSVEWAALGWILKRRKNCLISLRETMLDAGARVLGIPRAPVFLIYLSFAACLRNSSPNFQMSPAPIVITISPCLTIDRKYAGTADLSGT